ncbi:glycoside hydrolase family 3 protein [Erythrobacter sp. THAF29]|uniref:glycoside hydrolase family 3 protein n=1 Tax=Erythrobacter sp. THAF29 TaxID=2587851 RepID=UPI0012A92CB6|nr:glycoside hydrolase family 3 protein [Erythrobacter sp. THAF29]QFT78857.1 Periplasmic beta-glucosidase precursor [Erythrobacter sp. THAF29]
MRIFGRLMAATALAGLAAACSYAPVQTAASEAATEVREAAENTTEAEIADLVSRMSLERKVAQLIQPQINSVTPEEMRKYRWGSYLNGGNGGPYGDEFAPASEWLRLADEMWDASTAPLPGDEPVIPTMWGTDAVHGHTNVIGATIFPHNIGLGATRDLDLVRQIGAATATEIEVTGIDWNFSPTVAVARDDRWGRTYESYSENPELVAAMGAALIEGLQGKPGADDYLGRGRVIATAKHFFGDGGTEQGVDQGDVNGDIDKLKAIHAVPYPVAIDAGVETIMASFNSINGTKMHGNKELLTGVLREEMGFEGLVVGDWNAHGQIKGCTVSDCPQSLLAGLDIYMVPDDAVALYESLLSQVRDGTVPEARIDEAVTRILRVKMRAGLLGPDAKKPSQRANAGEYDKLGMAPHRAVAREAVAKSQVILKNNGVLPLKPGASILVAGEAADSIAQAAGGWTLTWQGGRELTNDPYFPGATSIWAGIEEAAREAGGAATLSADGSYSARPDVAIVVFGEQPYAEFAGDLKNMVFGDEEGLALLRKFEAEGIPAVAVFLSGRPLWMNRELNASDAFVASWLPGSEGAGVADVLFGKTPATGKLSFSWPANCEGAPVNGPEDALFGFGYGRSLTDTAPLGDLDETCGFLGDRIATDWYVNGRLTAGITASAGGAALPNLRGEAGGIMARGIDKDRQEDAREITFGPNSSITFAGEGEGAFVITYNLASAPPGTVTVSGGTTTTEVSSRLTVASGKGWREMVLTEACLGPVGEGLTISTDAPMSISIARISRQELPANTQCSF